MVNFQYKTRGQQSPQGKQRVYFTCHPEDFELYFEEVQKEILDRQDCAVFYLEPYATSEQIEDYELMLKEIQLIVIPITTTLLTKPSRIIDFDIPFAIEHHIPILPLMQEKGLEELYSRHFGNLQYLDKYNTDSTAISYDEKLTKYLESILIGDELSNKIRAAFDAYIFLSYRKKDRKHAQELMHLIHQNEFCRDIAIWYDEFLTPGENFNEAIIDALKKSKLFAMVVTPNLINEKNYVMTTEYPMARDKEKDILPVEMVKTDIKKLKSYYTNIPSIVNLSEEKELACRLKTIAIGENNNNPQHLYFIGLAYLCGIDVEINHEKAVELITDSANNGFLPAINKLIQMYEMGEGVVQDYRKVIIWQNKLVEIRNKCYKNKPSVDNALHLIDALERLGKYNEAIGQIDDAKQSFVKMHQYTQRCFSRYEDNRFIRYDILSCCHLGDIADTRGKLQLAKKWYHNGLDIIENLSKETSLLRERGGLSHIYDKLGDIYLKIGDYYEADHYYRKRLLIFENWVKESGSVAASGELVDCYLCFEKLASTQGDYNEAKQWVQKCFNVVERIFELTRDNSVRIYYLCSLFEKLGSLAISQQSIDEAEKWYHKIIDVNKSFDKDSSQLKLRGLMCVCYSRLGDISSERGQFIEANRWYHKGLSIFEPFSEKTCSIQERFHLSLLYSSLGKISLDSNRICEAKIWFERSLKIIENFTEETDTSDTYELLSITYHRLGEIAEIQGEPLLAIEWYTKHIETYNKHAKEFKKKQVSCDLFIDYNKLGDLCKSIGDYPEAITWYQKSIHISEILIDEEVNGVKMLEVICELNEELGEIYLEQGEVDKAKACLLKSLKINKTMVKEHGDVNDYRNILTTYDKLGEINKMQNRLDGAMNYYLRSLSICKLITKKTDNNYDLRNLSIAYDECGKVAEEQDKYIDAEKFYRHSLEICEQLYERVGDDALQDLSIGYKNLGKIMAKQDCYDEADRNYRKSLDIRNKLVEKNHSIESYRDLMLIYLFLGSNAEKQDLLDEAESLYNQSLKIGEFLISKSDGDIFHYVSNIYIRLGIVNEINEQFDEAEKWYRKSIVLLESLDLSDSNEIMEDIAFSYYNLGYILSDKSLLRKSLELYNNLLELYPNNQYYFESIENISELIEDCS